MSFEEDQGQSHGSFKFLSRGHGYGIFLTSAEAVLVVSGTNRLPDTKPVVLRMQLKGANPDAEASGINELPGKANYFLGRDPGQWRTNIPTYAKAKFGRIYPGIDLIYYGNRQQLEYDFVVAPGSDPDKIRLGFSGSRLPMMDADGNLVFGNAAQGEEFRLRKPVAYQVVNGNKREVTAEYVLMSEDEVRLRVGSYDVGEALVIDPIFAYSTYLGGLDNEAGYGIAVDGSGNAYVTGHTYSTTPPNANADPLLSDVFVSKLDRTGSTILYSSYFGGATSEFANAITVNGFGEAYITGSTDSLDFPTVTPLQPSLAGNIDAFVAKLNATGSSLLYSTYLGGSNFEDSRGIALDSSGNMYVAGYTQSTNYPLMNPLQPALSGDLDGFVTKVNAVGSALLYSTYLGGSGLDEGHGIAVDGAGKAYVTGHTNSPNFPTMNPLQPRLGGETTLPDAFVAQLNSTGSALVYSTYLGGSDYEEGHGIAIDKSGNAYVTGYTRSSDFPRVKPWQLARGGGMDAFVSKLNPAGSALVYSTYLGGAGHEEGNGIAVHGSGNAYVTGYTNSADFPAVNPWQLPERDDVNAFVAQLESAGTWLLYSTQLGGSEVEFGQSIAVDTLGNAYVSGYTSSTNFPVVNPVQPLPGGGYDAFITKIVFAPDAKRPKLVFMWPRFGAQGTTVNVTLYGTYFIAGATVAVSGAGVQAGPVTILSPTVLTTTLSIAPTAIAGIRDVSVTSAAGRSNDVIFIVTQYPGE